MISARALCDDHQAAPGGVLVTPQVEKSSTKG